MAKYSKIVWPSRHTGWAFWQLLKQNVLIWPILIFADRVGRVVAPVQSGRPPSKDHRSESFDR